MKEIQRASSLETVPEGSAMLTSYSKWSACLSRLFFSSSSAARLGAGAIWSVTHKEGKEREIWDTRVALIKLDKNTTVQNYKKTNNSFTIFAVQLH